jgi:pimeloyl-ACP methyl ester carboxylesterase
VLRVPAIRFMLAVCGADGATYSALNAWETAVSYIQHLHGDALTWFGITFGAALAFLLALLAPAFNNWWNARRATRHPRPCSPLAAVSSAIGAADDAASAAELLEELAAVTAVIKAATPRLRRLASPPPTPSATPRKAGRRSHPGKSRSARPR